MTVGEHTQINPQLIEDHEGISCLRNGAGSDHWNGLDYKLGSTGKRSSASTSQ